VLSREEAERANFLQYRVAAGSALDKAKELARLTAKNATLSNFAIINALPRIQDMAQDDGLFVESIIAHFTETSPDARDRVRAFLDKRATKLVAPVDSHAR
jgi:hypothetical protein